ncbi:anti-sigma factor [Sphingomonas sp. BIUV-7]|uniref:Regulator of SigK n=1 Tax=Sphingomonas natans TaxID=3063330 RepID=A0ABT8Y3S9_9SPHN|nr:anti-sigma factor [Sphingomonas sp. BIUV-7]MDO6412967.1 anti-sigma factor [Sphingomonas sp. BIUV-7]
MAEDFPEDAGEFVLGTLPPDERRDFLRRLAREPATVDAVRSWQERLAPLALAIEPVEPPRELERRVLEAIGIAPIVPAANDNQAGRWRIATAAASLVALVAAGLALRPHETTMPVPNVRPTAVQPIALRTTAIAALSAQGQTPGLFVTYDKVSGRMRIVPVGLTPDEAHSYELWLIEGKNAPKPMGLVDAKLPGERRVGSAMAMGATFAISREPVGGSTTGAPTGPVLFSGPLVAISPET